MESLVPVPTATSQNTEPEDRESRYGALPEEERVGVALCLSGGGYRAALFHLGGLERLNELGILSQVTTISSVSGGSIVNARIATALATGQLVWAEPGSPLPGWTEAITTPVRTFTRRNIRTRAILNRLKPRNWRHNYARAEGLADQYERHLTALPLRDLPAKPRFILSATDMAFGTGWTFESAPPRAGNREAGFTTGLPDGVPLARAVAASSCFPPVFNPIPAELSPDQLTGGEYRGDDRRELVEGIRLSDGGVFDNMGLEPVWDTHRWVLVSDGGAPFSAQRPLGLFNTLTRYQAINSNQAHSVRKRWLIRNFETGHLSGTYWGAASSPQSYPPEGTHPGYGEEVATAIARIRTDLDRSSKVEAESLITHGYFLASVAAGVYLKDLIGDPSPPTRPVPHPDDPILLETLEKSSKRKLFGRGFP